MSRKAIAILGGMFLIIVATLGVLIFSRTSKKPAAQTPPPQEQTELTPDQGGGLPIDGGTNPSSTPPAASGPVVRLTDEPVYGPVLTLRGDGVTYFTQAGLPFTADLDASSGSLLLTGKRAVEGPALPNVRKVYWQHQGNGFIADVAAPGSTARQLTTYDVQTQSYVQLPPQVYSFDWLPDGNIFYVWSNASGYDTVNIADPTTKRWRQVSDIWTKNAQVSVSPDGQNILFYRTGSTELENAIGLTSPDGKVWRSLITNGYNEGGLWSPDSKRFLFAKRDTISGRFQLWIYDILTGETKNLGLFGSTDKAVWAPDGVTLYTAVPQASGTGADTFFEVNTQTLEKREHPTGDLQVSAVELFTSRDSMKIFFRSTTDNALYYLDLTK